MLEIRPNPLSEIRNPDDSRNGNARSGPDRFPDSDFESRISEFTLWQLADSAFPTGGFAHSAGLEAAWQHGEVRNRSELKTYLLASLQQHGRAALPFVTTAHDDPSRLAELDAWCDAFTNNHVANRASRLQGRAFLAAVTRIFDLEPLERDCPQPQPVPWITVGEFPAPPAESVAAAAEDSRAPFQTSCHHFAPLFGAVTQRLGLPRSTAARLFFFSHLRGLLAAAVRLNIVGPMEAQAMQHRLSAPVEGILFRCEPLTTDDLAQTAPLLDLWQGAHDRLYSRLFQS